MIEKKGTLPEAIIRDIKRKTRCKFTAEEKVWIILFVEGFRKTFASTSKSHINVKEAGYFFTRENLAMFGKPHACFTSFRILIKNGAAKNKSSTSDFLENL